MKILLIGKENILRWLINTEDALESFQDIEPHTIKTNQLGFKYDLFRNILKIFFKKKSFAITNKHIESKIFTFKPDIIFVISPFLLGNEVINSIEKYNCYKIAWIGDRFGEHHKKIADLFDKLYFTDTGFINIAKKYNFPPSKYLPLAFNDNIFTNSSKNIKKEERLIFVGAYTKKRAQILNNIRYKNIEVYGPSWKNKLNKEIKVYNYKIDIYQLANLYKNSKYVLNIKHEHNIINGLNMRTFEAIASKSCLLQDYVKDVENNFEINKDIIIYRDINELNDIIKTLENNNKLYNKIVENGYIKNLKNNTYKNRISTILKDTQEDISSA